MVLAPQADVMTTFSALTPAQQQLLLDSCVDVDASPATMGDLCAIIVTE